MFMKRETRLGAAVLVALLSLASAAPAGAVGLGDSWEGPAKAVSLVLDWLGLGGAKKGEKGPSKGNPKGTSAAKADHGSQIDPNGNH